MILDFLGIGRMIKIVINSLFISIDGMVYYFVSVCYRLFILLATINIFDVKDYNDLVGRIYVILGVVMLFILSYTMLKTIIDPDGTEKSEDSPAKIVGKTVTSLILVIVMPVIFEYAYGFQVAILRTNTLGKIILGSPTRLDSPSGYSEDLQSQGSGFSILVFRSFFKPNEVNCPGYESFGDSTSYDKFLTDCEETIYVKKEENDYKIDPSLSDAPHVTLADAHVIAARSNFSIYSRFAEKVTDGEISYMFPLSLVAGIFLCYVMISFCFDLGIRVAKLAFLQIIAPIPVFARMMPGSAKEIFNNWVKKTTAVFLEVFLRVIIMFFGVYLIDVFSRKMWDVVTGDMVTGPGNWFVILFARVFVIMGIVAFIKQAPKLLGEIFPGMNSDGMSLGIMNKLGAGGGLAIAAGVGGLAMGGIRGFAKSRTQGKNLAKSALGGGLGGAVSGGRRALWQSRKAQNWAEMREGASEGIGRAADARTRKETYKANPELRGERMARRMSDFYHGPVDMERLEKKKGVFNDVAGSVDRLRTVASSEDKMFKTMMAQAEEVRKREIPTSVTEFDETAYLAAFNEAFTRGEDASNIRKEDYMRTRAMSAEETTQAIANRNQEANEIESRAKRRSGEVMNLLGKGDVQALSATLDIDAVKASALIDKFKTSLDAENAIIKDALLQYGDLRDAKMEVYKVHEQDDPSKGIKKGDFVIEDGNKVLLRTISAGEINALSDNLSGDIKDLSDLMQGKVIPDAEKEVAQARRTGL